MAQPVWVLSVDLQAKTAVFQSGMAEAAKSARGAFTEIKQASAEGGGAVATNMFEARHGVMLLGEEFGVRLPRALTAFITSIGPVGAAMEAAFPFLAIAVGATLLIQYLVKLHDEGQKLTEDQIKFGTAIENAFNTLDNRFLQAEIRSDELRNDHLGALRHQLELIDKTSMAELVHSFEEVAKSADVVFAGLKASWYQFGIGSTGAKHALDDFQTKYDALLAAGKDKEATDLLRGTRESAIHILALQEQAIAAQSHMSRQTGGSGDSGRTAYYQAINELKKAGIGTTEKEVAAQRALLEALNSQVGIEEKVTALKKRDSGNASASTGKEMDALRAEGAKTAAEHAQKMGEIALGAERESSNAALAIRSASIAERLAADEHLANEEYRIQSDGDKALIDALDKGGNDYNNQLHALQDKAIELTAQHNANLSNLEAKAREAQYREDLQNLTASEREKIEATMKGSRERLAAIDAALKEEQSKNLQDTAFYRDLLKQRVEVVRDATLEEAKLRAEAGMQAAENEQKMGELLNAAERQRLALRDSGHRVSIQMRMDEEIAAANDEFALKQRAMEQEAAALDKGAKDYENKLKAINNKELQLVREHENAITAIKDKAAMEQNQKQRAALTQLEEMTASGLSEVLMGHKSFASMLDGIGNQVVSGMLRTALMSIMTADMDKERQAASAARTMFLAGAKLPFPANIVAAPVMGAAAFASMMAFQSGGVVPGVGRGDIVPAMLEPGEGVVKNAAMDKLNRGELTGGTVHHHHINTVYHLQALDSDGMEKVLSKHSSTLAKHVGNEIRKLNR